MDMLAKDITTFRDVHAVLKPFYNNSRTKYDLTAMRKLMASLGNPQNSLRVIHVAGTSGKTSTAYYVSALLEATGATVGMTVSPHVDEINERVQLNHLPLAEVVFCSYFTQFLKLVETSNVQPSYFELMVAFAYWVFAKRKVDYAVIEVGLGGLLDATNVVDTQDKVCLITDIGLDHTEILGNSVEAIARQKAGIIQPNNPVFMHKQQPRIVKIVQEVCRSKSAELHLITQNNQLHYGLPLFQQRNIGLAIQAVNFIVRREGREPLTKSQIEQASKVYIAARMERTNIGGKVVIMDGSHNAQKILALAESIRAAYPNQSIAALIAFVDGTESRWQKSLDEIMKLTKRIIVTSFKAEQDLPKVSVEPNRIIAYCNQRKFINISQQQTPTLALKELLAAAEPLLLIVGSFYLLNQVRPTIVKL